MCENQIKEVKWNHWKATLNQTEDTKKGKETKSRWANKINSKMTDLNPTILLKIIRNANDLHPN